MNPSQRWAILESLKPKPVKNSVPHMIPRVHLYHVQTYLFYVEYTKWLNIEARPTARYVVVGMTNAMMLIMRETRREKHAEAMNV